jgi:hypothetical protein
MSEEQVMKKISNLYTYIICILMAIIMIFSFVPHTKSENTCGFLKTLNDNKNNDHLNLIDSVANDNCNKVDNKINDTLNNTINLKYKFCDSLQEKNLNESKTLTPTKRKNDVNNSINSNKDNVK